MSNLWRCLEALAGGNHVTAEWAKLAGGDFGPLRSAFLCDTQKRARFVLCPHGCGCEHEIVPRTGGKLAAVCRCEPWSCDDIAVTAADIALLGLNIAKLGREVCRAFGGTPKETDLGVQGTKQIGTFGNGALPLVLAFLPDTESFSNAVAQLAARLPERFILLSPTRQFLNGNSLALLKTAKAGFFDLETNLVLTSGGVLQARKAGGELFSPYLPTASEPASDDEARRLFALLKTLESESNYRKAPVTRVFQLYCLESKSRNAVATACRCVPSLVTLRLSGVNLNQSSQIAEATFTLVIGIGNPAPCLTNITFGVHNNDLGSHWYYQALDGASGSGVEGMLYLSGGQTGNSYGTWACADGPNVKLYCAGDQAPSLWTGSNTPTGNGNWWGIAQGAGSVVPSATPVYHTGNGAGGFNQNANVINNQQTTPLYYDPLNANASGSNAPIVWGGTNSIDQQGYSALYDAIVKGSKLNDQDLKQLAGIDSSITNAVIGIGNALAGVGMGISNAVMLSGFYVSNGLAHLQTGGSNVYVKNWAELSNALAGILGTNGGPLPWTNGLTYSQFTNGVPGP